MKHRIKQARTYSKRELIFTMEEKLPVNKDILTTSPQKPKNAGSGQVVKQKA